MDIFPPPPDSPDDSKEYQSMKAEWDAYFASYKYEARENEWRNAVLNALTVLNVLEDQHRSDPYKAVKAIVDAFERRAARRRSTD